MKTECPLKIFQKYSNIKFHEKSSSGNRLVPCGQPDMTKLVVALCNFANEPNTNKTADIHAPGQDQNPRIPWLSSTRRYTVHASDQATVFSCLFLNLHGYTVHQ